MIWLNLKELERRLAKREVSERTGFQYLLTIMIFFSVAKLLPDDSPFTDFYWDLSEFLIGLVVMIFGVSSTFKINSKGGGKDYLKRFLSLSFVVSLRLAIFLMLVYLLYKIVLFVIPLGMYLPIDSFISENISQLLLSTGVSLLYYFLLIQSFKRVHVKENFQAREFNAV